MNLMAYNAINEHAERTIWAVQKKNPRTNIRNRYTQINKKDCESKTIHLKNSANYTRAKPGLPRYKNLWYFVFVSLARAGVCLLFNGLLALLLSLFYVIREFDRFLHRGWAAKPAENPTLYKHIRLYHDKQLRTDPWRHMYTHVSC